MGKNLIRGLMIAVLVSGCQHRERVAADTFIACMKEGGYEVVDVQMEFDRDGWFIGGGYASHNPSPRLEARADACMSLIDQRFARPRLSPQP